MTEGVKQPWTPQFPRDAAGSKSCASKPSFCLNCQIPRYLSGYVHGTERSWGDGVKSDVEEFPAPFALREVKTRRIIPHSVV